MLPKRCVGHFGPAFVLEINEDGLITNGTWKQNEANPYDCASLDEFSLYLQFNVVGGSDKDSGFHNYLNFAEPFLYKFGTSAKLLEMGVHKGSSLALWSLYFPDSNLILGADILEDVHLDNELIGRGANIAGNVKLITADCTSPTFAEDHLENYYFNIMIDDASHIGRDQITTFENLFPSIHLLPGGVFWIEDVTDEDARQYFKQLVEFNYQFGTGLYSLTHLMDLEEFQNELDKDWRFLIESISFHGELVIIIKRDIPYLHLTPF